MDNYSIDLQKFELTEYQEILTNKKLLPGRIILAENIENNFNLLKKEGIFTIGKLLDCLKTKNKIESFSQKTSLSVEYLTILRRDAGSFLSKPVHLREFPATSKTFVQKLAEHGILHSKHYFELTITANDRENMHKVTEASPDEILKLTNLSNLVRINGVGPVFAIVLYDAGFNTIEKICQTKANEIRNKIMALNREKNYTKVSLGLSDIVYMKNFAQKLPLVTKY